MAAALGVASAQADPTPAAVHSSRRLPLDVLLDRQKACRHGGAELLFQQWQQKPDRPGRRGVDRQVEPGGTAVQAPIAMTVSYLRRARAGRAAQAARLGGVVAGATCSQCVATGPGNDAKSEVRVFSRRVCNLSLRWFEPSTSHYLRKRAVSWGLPASRPLP